VHSSRYSGQWASLTCCRRTIVASRLSVLSRLSSCLTISDIGGRERGDGAQQRVISWRYSSGNEPPSSEGRNRRSQIPVLKSLRFWWVFSSWNECESCVFIPGRCPNGISPVTSSHITIAMEYMSEAVVAPSLAKTSGAAYITVPITFPFPTATIAIPCHICSPTYRQWHCARRVGGNVSLT
jgi:hypothetical protein